MRCYKVGISTGQSGASCTDRKGVTNGINWVLFAELSRRVFFVCSLVSNNVRFERFGLLFCFCLPEDIIAQRKNGTRRKECRVASSTWAIWAIR